MVGTLSVTNSQTYASTDDLMARMGQDNPRDALIYQHASRHVDQTIANKLSACIEGIGSTAYDRGDDEEDGRPVLYDTFQDDRCV
jgi:hypothetical protein